jgi:hypothetical protein
MLGTHSRFHQRELVQEDDWTTKQSNKEFGNDWKVFETDSRSSMRIHFCAFADCCDSAGCECMHGVLLAVLYWRGPSQGTIGRDVVWHQSNNLLLHRRRMCELEFIHCASIHAFDSVNWCKKMTEQQNNQTRSLRMIGKYSKLILAVACVFIFALSLTVSITSSANACEECCAYWCPTSGEYVSRSVWNGTTGHCDTVLPSHCCYYGTVCLE